MSIKKRFYSKTHSNYYIDTEGRYIFLDRLFLAFSQSVDKGLELQFPSNKILISDFHKYYDHNTTHMYGKWLNDYVRLIDQIHEIAPDRYEIPDSGWWLGGNTGKKKRFIEIVDNTTKTTSEDDILHKIVHKAPKTFVVLDTETTGLNSELDSVIQIAAVKFEGGKEVGRFESFCNPSGFNGITRFITDLTGITPNMVANAPKFSEVLGDLLNFIGDSYLVGHNLSFDLKFLKTEFNRANKLKPQFNYIDTLHLSKDILPGRPSRGGYKLENLRELIPNSKYAKTNAHNAMNDCLVNAELFLWLMEVKNNR